MPGGQPRRAIFILENGTSYHVAVMLCTVSCPTIHKDNPVFCRISARVMNHFLAAILSINCLQVYKVIHEVTQKIQTILEQIVYLPSQYKVPESGLGSDRVPGLVLVFNTVTGSIGEGSCVAHGLVAVTGSVFIQSNFTPSVTIKMS